VLWAERYDFALVISVCGPERPGNVLDSSAFPRHQVIIITAPTSALAGKRWNRALRRFSQAAGCGDVPAAAIFDAYERTSRQEGSLFGTSG
jgi:hypothetical protein